VTQIIFTPAARVDLLETYDWYETQQANLGTHFQQEVEAVVARMLGNFYQFPIVFEDIHRALLKRFPYAIFFRPETDLLVVLACFHCSRDPRLWERRA
jgi:toxin ParE1/3/4